MLFIRYVSLTWIAPRRSEGGLDVKTLLDSSFTSRIKSGTEYYEGRYL